MVQTKRVEKISKGCLKPKSSGIAETKIWFHNVQEDFYKKLMVQMQPGDESVIERPIRV